MIALAFFVGLWLAMRRAREEGLDERLISDLGFWLVVAAIAGSRVLYVVLNYENYVERPLEIFMLWHGGLVFYGGLIAAVACGVWFVRRHRLPLGRVADIMAPSIALGQAIGRIGCFMAGCCYGSASSAPWAVTFSDPKSLAPLGVPLHPVQLYESGVALAIFVVLLAIYRWRRGYGQVFLSYAALYAAARFFLEFFRGDWRGTVSLGGWVLSTSQVISVVVFWGAVVLLVFYPFEQA